jgi:hypothetical protein
MHPLYDIALTRVLVDERQAELRQASALASARRSRRRYRFGRRGRTSPADPST